MLNPSDTLQLAFERARLFDASSQDITPIKEPKMPKINRVVQNPMETGQMGLTNSIWNNNDSWRAKDAERRTRKKDVAFNIPRDAGEESYEAESEDEARENRRSEEDPGFRQRKKSNQENRPPDRLVTNTKTVWQGGIQDNGEQSPMDNGFVNPVICYNCNELGYHFSRECPKPRTGDGYSYQPGGRNTGGRGRGYNRGSYRGNQYRGNNNRGQRGRLD